MLEHNLSFQFSALPPLSLYVHIPWCVRKCPYCDFNSHTAQQQIPEKTYISALLADLETTLPKIWGRTVQSVFFGGGTPSLFSAEGYDHLLSELRARLTFNAAAEITLEANPGTVEQQRFADYRALGINRLSLGIQSFDDSMLEKLGRIHSASEACGAVAAAQYAGFDNINLDLMYGLPGQSIQEALADLQQAFTLAPTHVSHYQLTLEPNTLFHHQPPAALPDNDLSWEMQLACQEELAKHDYAQYEISAYARPGRQCQHNLNYWQFGDYLGIGAGAHAKISLAQPASIERSWKYRQPADYIQRSGNQTQTGGTTLLTPQDAMLEFVMNALRLNEGFSTDLFEQHSGLSQNALLTPLLVAEGKGWIERSHNRIKATPKGQQYLNDLVGLFMED
jgi:oxygen-independent coproporphyrinogen-3 oxidase